MQYNFDNERPIYIQLVEMLKIEIISGRIKCGEKLSSVRDFASLLKVNPNTMQKALGELEREGLIFTERTNGKYVTNNEELIKKEKSKLAYQSTNKYIEDMRNIGIDKFKIIDYLKKERDD